MKALAFSLVVLALAVPVTAQESASDVRGAAFTSDEIAGGEPPYARPPDIEQQILQFIAERQPTVLSINSVTCTSTNCEIAFVGADPNPRFIDAHADFDRALHTERWKDFRILSGNLGTREMAPGAREYVVGFIYQPLVELSADPRTAARQHAACAAAWQRATTNPTPEKYVRQYLAIAERYLALAAAELGRVEAERIARATNLGPVIRQCGGQPP
jgi:hypothetical protein